MMTAISLFFNTYRMYAMLALGVILAGLLAWFTHAVYARGEAHNEAKWQARVQEQQVRAMRAQTELEQTNRYLLRQADQVLANRDKVIKREQNIADLTIQRMRAQLADSVPRDSGACEPVVSVATQCIDSAAETSQYAIGAYEAADANADQVDGLLQWVEAACKTWNKDLKLAGDCPDTGAAARLKLRASAVVPTP